MTPAQMMAAISKTPSPSGKDRTDMATGMARRQKYRDRKDRVVERMLNGR